MTGTLVAQTRRRRRPGGGPLETVTEWQGTVQRGDVRQAVVEDQRIPGRTFVLIAHDPDRSAQALLSAYHEQFVGEASHAVLKGPREIAPVFLKDPKKLTAYVYVGYLAALRWSVMQAVARRTAAARGVRLPYPNGRLQAAPTAKRIKELLEPVILMRYHGDGVRYRAVNELTWVQRLACLLLEIPPAVAHGRTVRLAVRIAKPA